VLSGAGTQICLDGSALRDHVGASLDAAVNRKELTFLPFTFGDCPGFTGRRQTKNGRATQLRGVGNLQPAPERRLQQTNQVFTWVALFTRSAFNRMRGNSLGSVSRRAYSASGLRAAIPKRTVLALVPAGTVAAGPGNQHFLGLDGPKCSPNASSCAWQLVTYHRVLR